jgi:hypothetical protein
MKHLNINFIKNDIYDAVDKIIDLLNRTNYFDKSDWFKTKLTALKKSAYHSDLDVFLVIAGK